MANTHSLELEASSSQYAEAADSASLSLTGDFTIELWVKLESLPAFNQEMAMISKSDGAPNRSYIFRFINLAGTYQVRLGVSSNGTNSNDSVYTYTPPTGTWFHIAITFNGGSGATELFIDGVSQGTSSNAFFPAYDGTAIVYVGATAGSNLLDGLIDDVRIWSVIRTSTEIDDNKELELVGNESGLEAYWKFNNAYTDSTANGNTLTPSNSPTFSTDVPFVGSTAHTKDISETVTNTDSITTLRTATILNTETVTHTDTPTLTYVFLVTVSETATHIDTVIRTWTRSLSETGTFTDSIVTALAKTFLEVVSHTESFVKSIIRVFSEVGSFLDTLSIKNLWTERTKPTTAYTDRTEPTTVFTKRTEPTTVFTDRVKPTSPWTDRTKPPTSWG